MEDSNPADAAPLYSHYTCYDNRVIAGVQYLGVRQNDTAGSSWHVISQYGVNYGAWQSMENFVKARKLALKLKDGETTDKLTATPLGKARLSVRNV